MSSENDLERDRSDSYNESPVHTVRFLQRILFHPKLPDSKNFFDLNKKSTRL